MRIDQVLHKMKLHYLLASSYQLAWFDMGSIACFLQKEFILANVALQRQDSRYVVALLNDEDDGDASHLFFSF